MKKVTVVFRDEELYRALKVRAASQGRSLQSVITEALEQWIDVGEDAEDTSFAEAAMREEGKNIPWEKVRVEMRSYNPPG
jgi:plasmid stability protein